MISETELKIIEVIARMKSNIGDSQAWAKELEHILGIQDMRVTL